MTSLGKTLGLVLALLVATAGLAGADGRRTLFQKTLTTSLADGGEVDVDFGQAIMNGVVTICLGSSPCDHVDAMPGAIKVSITQGTNVPAVCATNPATGGPACAVMTTSGSTMSLTWTLVGPTSVTVTITEDA